MITLMRAVVVLLVSSLAAVGQSPAQNWNNAKALAAGTAVRVKVNSRTIRGQIQGVTDDALTVNSGKGQEMLTRQEILRVSVKTKSHRGRNTLIGLGAGAAAGLVIGVASYRACTGWCIFTISRGGSAAIGAIGFGAIGTLAGALIPTGGWHEVYKQ